jgi:hypothetical protein
VAAHRPYRGVRPLDVDRGIRLKRPDLVRDYVDLIPAVIDQIVVAALPRVICSACGCLCLEHETCPGCLSNALDAAEAAVLGVAV